MAGPGTFSDHDRHFPFGAIAVFESESDKMAD